MSGLPYSQVARLQNGILTLSSGAKTPLTPAPQYVRWVNVFPTNGSPLIGNAAAQFAPSLSLNPAQGKFVDLNTIYVSGSAGDTVQYLYDDTYP